MSLKEHLEYRNEAVHSRNPSLKSTEVDCQLEGRQVFLERRAEWYRLAHYPQELGDIYIPLWEVCVEETVGSDTHSLNTFGFMDDYGNLEEVKLRNSELYYMYCAASAVLEVTPPLTKLPQESGWEIFSHLATTDGMLLVRWLNWYESRPYNVTEREVLCHEGCHGRQPQREVAAEAFPIEIGSLQSRWFYEADEKVCFGLVLDAHQSVVRKVFPTDCYSETRKGQLVNTRGREHKGGLRAAYECVPIPTRANDRRHTEIFVSEAVPAALVVYGDKRGYYWQQSLIRQAKMAGLPVIIMNVR